MKKFVSWISSKFIRDYQNINNLKVRARYGSLEGWVSIICNIFIFLIKIILGISIKSVSLIADAIHTLADSVTSIIIIFGFKMIKKPSDKEHPFGHGRIEYIVALIVSVLLFVAGVEFMERSIRNIINPEASRASFSIILIITGTILIKEFLSRFSFELGDIIDSKALKADALHHRSDVFATALVVVALVASHFGYSIIDGIMGILVSLIIAYSAYIIAKEAISPLLGEAPSKETLEKIENLAKNFDGVLDVHDIILHKYGNTNIISLHIEVSGKESAYDLHDLSEHVEDEIGLKMGGNVIVHIDPINKDHPEYDAVSQAIKRIVSEDSRINSFHDLRIVGGNKETGNVVFDIVLEDNVDEQENYDVICTIQEKFKKIFPDMKTIINAEPKYVSLKNS